MKKLILVTIAVLFSLGTFAQNDTMRNKKGHDKMMDKKMKKPHPDGVMMMDGKMMMIKNGKMTMMQNDATMSNGTKVMTNGSVMKNDGTTMMLKNGDHIDMSGKMIAMKMPKTRE